MSTMDIVRAQAAATMRLAAQALTMSEYAEFCAWLAEEAQARADAAKTDLADGEMRAEHDED